MLASWVIPSLRDGSPRYVDALEEAPAPPSPSRSRGLPPPTSVDPESGVRVSTEATCSPSSPTPREAEGGKGRTHHIGIDVAWQEGAGTTRSIGPLPTTGETVPGPSSSDSVPGDEVLRIKREYLHGLRLENSIRLTDSLHNVMGAIIKRCQSVETSLDSP